jgi:hypothetical protein
MTHDELRNLLLGPDLKKIDPASPALDRVENQ